MSPARRLTPRGAGGVAVVAVEGAGALERLAALSGGALPEPGGIRIARLASAGEELDEVLLCRRADGRVELHLHGSPPLVDEVLRLLEPRPEGEEHAGSLEERARRLVPTARSEAAARTLLDQAEGALRREVAALAEMDPADPRWSAELSALRERGRWLELALEPRTIVLAGRVNAGKSTLFNVLVGEGRVVVSAEEGTTRDAVREPAHLGAWPVELVDTAGERALVPEDPSSGVEAAGQDAGRRERAGAHLVLWLEPAGDRRRDRPAPPEGALSLVTFADRGDAPGGRPAVSAVHRAAEAQRTVAELFRSRFELPVDPWRAGRGVPFEGRQRALLDGLRRETRAEERARLFRALLD